jgi:hypothetical protein
MGDASNRRRLVDTSVLEVLNVFTQSAAQQYRVKLRKEGRLHEVGSCKLRKVGPHSMLERQFCRRVIYVDDRGAADPLFRFRLRFAWASN